jgi:hypothetical protein
MTLGDSNLWGRILDGNLKAFLCQKLSYCSQGGGLDLIKKQIEFKVIFKQTRGRQKTNLVCVKAFFVSFNDSWFQQLLTGPVFFLNLFCFYRIEL